jgi:tetratricopeptide (TPR) repeat protein
MGTRKTAGFRIAAAALTLALPVAGCSKEAKKNRIYFPGRDNYFKSGGYEKAKIEYLNVLKVDPQNAVAIRQLGLIWTEQGALLRAGPYLFKTRELEPENLEVRVKLMQAMVDVGQIAQARKEAIGILEKNPAENRAFFILMDTARAQEELDEVQNLVEKHGTAGAIPHLVKANIALKSKDFDAVQSELDQALAAEPKSAQVHMAQAKPAPIAPQSGPS